MSINMRIETISPEQAKKYLERNHANRNINEGRVTSYARDMKNGGWQLNGEAIKFNKSGELIDGQHRLTAIIRSGVPVTMCVIVGLDASISEVDRGKPRTTKDTLTIDGFDKSIIQNNMVGAVRLLAYIMFGFPMSNLGIITDREIKETYIFYEREIKQIQSVNFCAGAGITRKSPVIACMLMALKCGVDISVIDDFGNVLNTGRYTNNKQLSAMVLRDDFLQNKFRKNNKIRGYEQINGIEKAIYDFEKGITRKQTYSTCDTPIYSCSQLLKKEKEEE